MVTKEDVPGVSLMDGRQTTQPCSPIDSETGSALEKQDGSHIKKKAGLLQPFFILALLTDFVLAPPYRTGLS